MGHHRRVKILATIGPGTRSPAAIQALLQAGADVFRLNFSHGSHEDHAEAMRIIRALENDTGRAIGVLADLQGPKLRVGTFAEGKVELAEGTTFRLDLDPTPGDASRVHLPHPEILKALEPGARLLLDDGKIALRTEEANQDHAVTTVVTGGPLSDRKGVSVPDSVLAIDALTKKDVADLGVALDLGVDWVALSFVQRPADVAQLRKLVGGRAAVLSKLEKPRAMDHLDEIIEQSDGVMVARGDLGVECPPELVPILQKRIITACRHAGKPVVVATQMLESMISAPAPTRAEASDVATAVYDGADAVMLSAETAVGRYPAESVNMMARIIEQVEHDSHYRKLMDASRGVPERTAADAISAAARQVADTLGVAAIVTYTHSGSTSLRAARERPSVPILCLTPYHSVARKLTLAWGTRAVVLHHQIQRFNDVVAEAIRIAKAFDYAGDGERLVITSGLPFGRPGTTNMLRITWTDEEIPV